MALIDDISALLTIPISKADLVAGLAELIDNLTYAHVTAADAATDVTAAELEELTAGGETVLHSHAGGGGFTQEQIEDFVGAMMSGNTETGITVTYQDADSTIDFEVLPEFIADTVGAMIAGNTETGITVTYDDADNTLDFVLDSEITTFFANTDITGAEAEDLTDGGVTALHSHAGDSGQLSIQLNADAGTNIQLTNQANGEAFFTGQSRTITKVDLANYTQARLVARVITASGSANNPRLELQYHTSFSTTATDYSPIGTSAVQISMASTGVIDSGWIDLAAGAIANDIFIALIQDGGDGAADPVFGHIACYFK